MDVLSVRSAKCTLIRARTGAMLFSRRGWAGLMAASGVSLVRVVGGQALRMVVGRDLSRAEAEGRLGSEFRAYGLAFLAVAIPATVLAAAFSHFWGELFTGRLP